MKEASKIVINPHFVQAMRTMAEDCSLENQNNMVEAMMGAHLLTPVIRQYQKNSVGKASNMRVNFRSIKNKEGDAYILAFTDLIELKKWRNDKDADNMVMEFDDYASLFTDPRIPYKGFVINPFGENITVSRSRIMKLKEKKDQLKGM